MPKKQSNPFNLYLTDGGKQSKQIEKNARMMTRKFKALWKNLVQDWRVLQKEGDALDLGASDTEAREDQANWIRKHAYEIN
jgi:hypothetical protein